MSGRDPDPVAAALVSLRESRPPVVDVADRVLARVSRLPVPVRVERRFGFGAAAAVAALALGAAAFAPALGPVRLVATEASPAVLAVLRGLVVALAATGEAFVRVAGGLDGVRSVTAALGTGALGACFVTALLLLAREIRRAPALVRSPR